MSSTAAGPYCIYNKNEECSLNIFVKVAPLCLTVRNVLICLTAVISHPKQFFNKS